MRGFFTAALCGLALIAVIGAMPGSSGAASGAPVLTGTVGPGFTITLKDARGRVVTRLKAGKYVIRVRDRSPIHNFHLFGPGIGKLTSVPGTGLSAWTVRLRRGVYRYQCDPHRTIMHGRLTVA